MLPYYHKNSISEELILSHSVPPSVVARVVRTITQILINSESNLHHFEKNNGFVVLAALFNTFPEGIDCSTSYK